MSCLDPQSLKIFLLKPSWSRTAWATNYRIYLGHSPLNLGDRRYSLASDGLAAGDSTEPKIHFRSHGDMVLDISDLNHLNGAYGSVELGSGAVWKGRRL